MNSSWPSIRQMSNRVLCGSQCICSPCTPDAAVIVAASLKTCFVAASVYPAPAAFQSKARARNRTHLRSPVWKPMHLQPLYAGCRCYRGSVAEDLFRRGICLPSSSSLSIEDQRYVIDQVRIAAHTRPARNFKAWLPQPHEDVHHYVST